MVSEGQSPLHLLNLASAPFDRHTFTQQLYLFRQSKTIARHDHRPYQMFIAPTLFYCLMIRSVS